MKTRLFKGIAIGFVGLLVLGAVFEVSAGRRDDRNYPPPGMMIDVEGGTLHLQVSGVSGPTVLLEAGLGGFAAQWGWIEPEIAEFAQVVAYDRVGLGWSPDADVPRDAIHTVERLREALDTADIEGPYVLVGHSMGGLITRVFADRYPEDVAGMVLVDSSHPDQFQRIAGLESMSGNLERVAGLLARVGIVRVVDPTRFFATDLPEAERNATRSFFAKPRYWNATRSESVMFDEIAAQAGATGDFGDLPLGVITAENEYDEWAVMQEELAALSKNSRHVIRNDADHLSVMTNRDHAMETVALVRWVIDEYHAER